MYFLTLVRRARAILLLSLSVLLLSGSVYAFPITQNVQRSTQYMSTTPIINSHGTTCTGGSCAVCASVTTVATIVSGNTSRGMWCLYTSALLNGAYGGINNSAPAITPTSANGIPMGPVNTWLCEVGAPGNRFDVIPQTGTASVCTIEYPLQ
jgi:hypothetical protein